jgi:hypothetical protein
MNWLYTKRSILQGTVQQDIQSLDRFNVIYVELAELLHSNSKSWLFVQRMTSQHKARPVGKCPARLSFALACLFRDGFNCR